MPEITINWAEQKPGDEFVRAGEDYGSIVVLRNEPDSSKIYRHWNSAQHTTDIFLENGLGYWHLYRSTTNQGQSWVEFAKNNGIPLDLTAVTVFGVKTKEVEL